VAQRYAMYYRHEPGAIFRILGKRRIFPVARLLWRLGNLILGRFGNKMVVVARRRSAQDAGWLGGSEGLGDSKRR